MFPGRWAHSPCEQRVVAPGQRTLEQKTYSNVLIDMYKLLFLNCLLRRKRRFQDPPSGASSASNIAFWINRLRATSKPARRRAEALHQTIRDNTDRLAFKRQRRAAAARSCRSGARSTWPMPAARATTHARYRALQARRNMGFGYPGFFGLRYRTQLARGDLTERTAPSGESA